MFQMTLFSKIMVFVLFALEMGMLQGCESQKQKRFVERSVSATELMSHYMRDASHADEIYAGSLYSGRSFHSNRNYKTTP